MKQEPLIHVGILSAPEIKVALLDEYYCPQTGRRISGPLSFSPSGGMVSFDGDIYESVSLEPIGPNASFEVFNVTIGVNFHWQRQENQRFSGAVRIINENGVATLINILPVEDYLCSVISSEMSATASLEFLKAHAIISRSWVLAQTVKSGCQEKKSHPSFQITDDEIIRWYDREDHVNFDVCADDHCQRYQGITRQTTPTVRNAVEETRGIVLTDEKGKLADARFSKCCGGVFEEFENCWEPVHHSYLASRRDSADSGNYPDLTIEDNARKWIMSQPTAFCNTSDRHILSQVLNNYDQETTHFYRWTVSYTQDELSKLISERSGIDFGLIKSLDAVERGTSGRIVRLRVCGTKRTMIIGKELEIRRILSTSHLYSSAFVAVPGADDCRGIPSSFRLYGAGWGHGVGLCQIGAAVMSTEGYKHDEILRHYFPGAVLTSLYQ